MTAQTASPACSAVALQPMSAKVLPTILAVEELSHAYPWSLANFLDSLRVGWHTQCLMVDGQVLGYFVAMPGVDEVHLLNLTVAPQNRGQGWARVLLDALALWGRTLRARWIWLEVRSGNARALHIYEQYGFIRTGLRKNYYRNPSGEREDAVLMSCPL